MLLVTCVLAVLALGQEPTIRIKDVNSLGRFRGGGGCPGGYGGPGSGSDTGPETHPPTTPTTQPGPSSTRPDQPTTPSPSRTPAALTPSMPTTPTTIGNSVVATTLLPWLEVDLDAWSTWWKYNRESFLALPLHRPEPVTSAGMGTEDEANARRADRAALVEKLARALDGELASGLRGAILLALARIAVDEPEGQAVEELLVAHLAAAELDVAETACAALGILGRPSSAPLLAQLLGDSDAGRKLHERKEVSSRMRTFAAASLGLLARRTENSDVLRYATHALAESLLADGSSPADRRIAALVSLRAIDAGARDGSGLDCPCSSNEALARSLLAMLDNEREDDLVRAHVPAVLARLARDVPEALREEIALTLLRIAERRQAHSVIVQGVLLALGEIGDAGEESLDRRIRATLTKLASDSSFRGCASIALAEAGSQLAVNGKASQGTLDVLGWLVKRAMRSNSQERAWAAIALGVLGRRLDERGASLPEDELLCLEQGIERSGSGDLCAAFSVAAGLARKREACSRILERLDDLQGEELGHMALALGLAGAPEAIGPLHQQLSRARHQPLVLEEVALALALLDDARLVDELVALLDECDCTASRMGVAASLGRSKNPRAVEPLLALFEDREGSELERAWAALGLAALVDPDERRWSEPLTSGLHYRACPATITGPGRDGILDLP